MQVGRRVLTAAVALAAWVYIYYTTAENNRVARLHLGEEPEPILTGIPGGDFHNGGRIAFGPDGMLYVATGETFETPTIAQDPYSLGGKILRITPDGDPAPDNPSPDSAVYSMGHRNVQGLAWDSDGQLYAAELGEGRCDELNAIEPGANYGWPEVEGDGDDPGRPARRVVSHQHRVAERDRHLGRPHLRGLPACGAALPGWVGRHQHGGAAGRRLWPAAARRGRSGRIAVGPDLQP